MTTRETWDYIVVGGGSAGCVLANRLSADGTTRVLVLEAGGHDWSPYIRIPAGRLRLARKYDWEYPSEPDESCYGKRTPWAAGRVLGGGSSVNAMLWVRGHPSDYDYWAEQGCAGWSYSDLLPYFCRAERFKAARADSAARGTDGPQSVTLVHCPHMMTDAFVSGAREVGFAHNEDYNDGEQRGVSYAQVSQRRGLRASTARAYLAPAARRRNLHVRVGATVERIVISDGRAVGVRYRQRGQTITAHADREVVLSAGAIGSPKLLMLSGIGRAATLRSLGIAVAADVPSVGENLQEHPFATVRAIVNTPTLNTDVNPLQVARHAFELAVHGTGAATAPLSHAVAFGKNRNERSWSDYELMFSPFGVIGGDQQGSKYLPTTVNVSEEVNDMHRMKIPAIRIAVGVLHPHSRGRITLRSADPGEPPRIDHALLSDDRDTSALIDAVRCARNVIQSRAFARYVVEEHAPGPACQSDNELEQFIRSTASRGQHPIGTCRMGADDASVVDLELRVRGVAGLRVVDASIMPSLTSGNTNAPVIAIAERAADLIQSPT